MVAPTDAKQIRESGVCNSVDAATIGGDVRILAVTPAGTKDELITISELAKLTGGGVLHNLDANRDPLATDDTGSGYVVGSLWRNDTSRNTWAAADVTAGAAVWDPIGSTADNADSVANLAARPAVGTKDDGYRVKVATNGLTYVVIDGAYEVEDYEIRVATDAARLALTEQETGQRVNVDADDKRYRWDGAWQEIAGGTTGTVVGTVRATPTLDVAPTATPVDGSWELVRLSNNVREVWFRGAGVWSKQATWAADENIFKAPPAVAEYNPGNYIWLNEQVDSSENGLYELIAGAPNVWLQRGSIDTAIGGGGDINIVESLVGRNEADTADLAWFSFSVVAGKVGRLALQLFNIANVWKKPQTYVATTANATGVVNIDLATDIEPVLTLTGNVTDLVLTNGVIRHPYYIYVNQAAGNAFTINSVTVPLSDGVTLNTIPADSTGTLVVRLFPTGGYRIIGFDRAL